MKKGILFLMFLMALDFLGYGQISFQGFEAGDTWTILSGDNISTNTGSSDFPSNQRIKNGNHSHQTINTTRTLILNGFADVSHVSRYVDVWLSSTSGTSGNGADGADFVEVYVSSTSTFSATPDVKINGNSNVRHGIDGTGVISTTAGTSVTYSYPSGGTKTNNDAKSKISINIPDAWTSVHLKIITKNNTSDERWNIDDIGLYGTVASSNDADSEVYDTGSQPMTANISSTATASGDAVDVINMTIEDAGTADGLATKVTNIRLKPHTSNTADWTDHIQGIVIDDGASFLTPSSVTITDTYIDIALPNTELNIADGGSTDVTIAVYLNSSNIVDGAIFSCFVDADDHGFTADVSGSSFISPFTLGDFNSNDFTMDVEATELQIQTQPSDVNQGDVMSPAVVVAYTDANGNVDVDYDGLGSTATLSATGATLDGATTTAGTPVMGIMSFSDIQFSTSGAGVTLTITDAAGITNPAVTSNAFVVAAPLEMICYTEDFVDFSDWTDSGTAMDNSSSHYGAASPCRAFGLGDNLISPGFDKPSNLSFHQDASNGGNNKTATVEYRIGTGAWTSLHSFSVSSSGADESISLTNVGGVDLSTMDNVSFRFNSTFNTWYLDDVVVRGTNCALPITLLTFTAKTINNQTHLNWQTATEVNNDYMAVERSADGRRFEEIGRVEGVGTTLEAQDYAFVDKQPLNGVNYYRLRQVDFDGRAEYHQVVSILVRTEDSDIRIVPTAATDEVMIYLPEVIQSDALMNIYDVNGKLWQKANLSAGSIQESLNVSNLPNGHYILRVIEGQNISTVRFNKL